MSKNWTQGTFKSIWFASNSSYQRSDEFRFIRQAKIILSWHSSVERPIVENPKIKDPNWLAGFTEAEGCFFINIYKSQTKLGETVKLHFDIDQHVRDDALLISFIYFFNCGTAKKNKDVSLYRVTKLDDIANKIIPFFQKNQIPGVKALDFADWCKVAEMMKQKKTFNFWGIRAD